MLLQLQLELLLPPLNLLRRRVTLTSQMPPLTPIKKRELQKASNGTKKTEWPKRELQLFHDGNGTARKQGGKTVHK